MLLTALKTLRSSAPFMAVVGALLLLPAGLAAGAWAWPRGWIFLGAVTAVSVGGQAILAVVRPASYAVRQQGMVADKAKRQPLIDAFGLVFYAICLAAWLAFIPLDVFRLHLLPQPPLWLAVCAGLIGLAGVAISFVAIGQNQFAAPTIHDQSAEGQRVIQTGLYGVVRHPFYAGMLLFYAGAALWLGSTAGALATTAFLAMTLARIVIEEAWLRQNLAGYGAYARRVRGRLIPYLL